VHVANIQTIPIILLILSAMGANSNFLQFNPFITNTLTHDNFLVRYRLRHGVWCVHLIRDYDSYKLRYTFCLELDVCQNVFFFSPTYTEQENKKMWELFFLRLHPVWGWFGLLFIIYVTSSGSKLYTQSSTGMQFYS